MVKIRPARSGSGLEADIRFRWPDGSVYRERRKVLVTGRAAAQRWAEARERELLARGRAVVEVPPAPETQTLEDFWPRVVRDHYRANRKKPSTIDAAETIYRRHLSTIGRKPLDSITIADIAAIKGRLAESAPKTVNNVLTVLSRTLRCAVEWGVILAMPCRIALLKTMQPAMAWYEREDYRRLVAAASSARVRLLVLLAGSAGLRRGEIIALKWTDIDLVRKQIRVERGIWRGHEESPKGGRHRVVPLTPELAGVLKEHRHLGERVLYDDKGRELSNRTIRNWLRQAQRRAGLPLAGAAKREKDRGGAIHMLRHTFCSHLAAAGVPGPCVRCRSTTRAGPGLAGRV